LLPPDAGHPPPITGTAWLGANGVNWITELGVVEVGEVVGRWAAKDQPDLA
jgi:hypothetical protein